MYRVGDIKIRATIGRPHADVVQNVFSMQYKEKKERIHVGHLASKKEE